MDKIKHCINHNRFIPVDTEELTALELIGKSISKINELIDTLETKTNLLGDHKGTWQGISKPTLTDEGLKGTVEKHIIDIQNLNNTTLTNTNNIINNTKSIEENTSKINDNINDILKIKTQNIYLSTLEDSDQKFNFPTCKNSITTNKSLKIAVVGDSITEGSNIDYNGLWFNKFTNSLVNNLQGVSCDIRNYCLGGRRLEQFANDNYVGVNSETDINLGFKRPWSVVGKSWKQHIKDFSPDMIIFAFGMNDTETTDDTFAYLLTTLIQEFKTIKSTDITLVTTILPTQNKNIYQQDLEKTQCLANTTRIIALKNKYGLIDSNRAWNNLINGHDLKVYNNDSIYDTSKIEEYKPLNMAFNVIFRGNFPTSNNSCDLKCRGKDNNYLLFRFKNDGTGNFIDLYIVKRGTPLLVGSVAGSTNNIIALDNERININGTMLEVTSNFFNGDINLSQVKPHILEINFSTPNPIKSTPMYSELELLGKVTTPFGQGYNGNGINHPTVLGHTLAYYNMSKSIIKSLS